VYYLLHYLAKDLLLVKLVLVLGVTGRPVVQDAFVQQYQEESTGLASVAPLP
jgi:hypothetical protein